MPLWKGAVSSLRQASLSLCANPKRHPAGPLDKDQTQNLVSCALAPLPLPEALKLAAVAGRRAGGPGLTGRLSPSRWGADPGQPLALRQPEVRPGPARRRGRGPAAAPEVATESKSGPVQRSSARDRTPGP
jgi:hypothetical protein